MSRESSIFATCAFLLAAMGAGCPRRSTVDAQTAALSSESGGDSSDGGSTGGSGGSGSGADDGGVPADPSNPQPAHPKSGFLGGFFPVGVFGQPAYTIKSWSSVGLNTMLGASNGENLTTWDAEARKYGMAMIRPPLPVASQDIGRTDLLAWLLPDEPDVEANNGPCGGNCVSLIQSMASQWRGMDPDRKIFVNVAGPNVLYQAACDYCNGPGDETPLSSCYPNNDHCYPAIIDTSDFISEDIYPVTGWLPDESLRGRITVVGDTLDRLSKWTDKPLFAIIELSNQKLGFDGTGTRGPTPDEYRAELWNAIVHGARGIFYFPQAFNPFVFEAIEPDVLAEMKRQHKLLKIFGSVLQTDQNPEGAKVSVKAPLEVTWRQDANYTWLFVVNTVNASGIGGLSVDNADGDVAVYGESRSVKAKAGAFEDEFDPYAVHIYAIPR